MTSEKIRDTKLRTLIKAFLVFHKGKKFTAKRLAVGLTVLISA